MLKPLHLEEQVVQLGLIKFVLLSIINNVWWTQRGKRQYAREITQNKLRKKSVLTEIVGAVTNHILSEIR